MNYPIPMKLSPFIELVNFKGLASIFIVTLYNSTDLAVFLPIFMTKYMLPPAKDLEKIYRH